MVNSKHMFLVAAIAMALSPTVSFAQGKEKAPATKATLPCKIYGNADDEGEGLFVASGWMGSTDAIELDDSWKEKTHTGSSCIRVSFSDPKGWGGVAWQNPANNWGDDEGGVDLTGAKQLSFWARGEKGGEVVDFKLGMIQKNKPYWDTAKVSLEKVKLTAEWKQYVIPLTGKDLSRIVTGFAFAVKGKHDPVTFYLDDMVIE